MPQVDVNQARLQLNELLGHAFQGEDALIMKDGRPFVRLTAPDSSKKKRKRQFGSVEGEIWMSGEFDEPLDEVEEYR